MLKENKKMKDFDLYNFLQYLEKDGIILIIGRRYKPFDRKGLEIEKIKYLRGN